MTQLEMLTKVIGDLDCEYNRVALESQGKGKNYWGELAVMAFGGRIKPEMVDGYRNAVKGATSLDDVAQKALDYIMSVKPN